MKRLALHKGCIIRKFFFKNIDLLKILFLEYRLASKFETDNEASPGSVHSIFEKKSYPQEKGEATMGSNIYLEMYREDL